MEGNTGKGGWRGWRRGTLFNALTHRGKNSFHTHTHLLRSTRNSRKRERGCRGTRENNQTWSENRKRKTERERRICILTSHSKAAPEPSHHCERSGCLPVREGEKQEEIKKRWAGVKRIKQWMWKKESLFSTNCRKKKKKKEREKGVEEEWGCAITCSFLKCLCFVTRFFFFLFFSFFFFLSTGGLRKVGESALRAS